MAVRDLVNMGTRFCLFLQDQKNILYGCLVGALSHTMNPASQYSVIITRRTKSPPITSVFITRQISSLRVQRWPLAPEMSPQPRWPPLLLAPLPSPDLDQRGTFGRPASVSSVSSSTKAPESSAIALPTWRQLKVVPKG